MQFLAKWLGPIFAKEIIDKVVDVITDYLISRRLKKIRIQTQDRQDKRHYLVGAIEKAQTNEERKHLSILLADIDGFKLPDTDSKRD